jgi:hypothetical protein
MSKLIGNEFAEIVGRLAKGEMASWQERAKANYIGDRKTADAARSRMFQFNQELMAAIKAEGLKYEGELKPNVGESEEEKATRLLTAFARGTRLTRVWNDVIQLKRIGACCSKKTYKFVLRELDAMNRRGDLVMFLDDPDFSIRAKTAACLLNTMPDRCLPILLEINRTQGVLNAGWIAFWSLDMYETETGVKYK